MSKKIIIPILLILALGGYFGYTKFLKKSEVTRYVLASVQKGTIIVSVSGSGQVNVSDQIDIKSKIAGEVVDVKIENNQEVKAGTLIAQLDTRDAQKAVRDAEINLANAELALKNIKGKAAESLAAAYNDGLNALTNTFKELSPIMTDLKKMFTESSYSGDDNDVAYYLHLVRAYNNGSYQLSYWDDGAEGKYLAVEKEFDAVKMDYFALNQNSSYSQIEIIINQTYDMARIFLELVRQSYNLAQKYQTVIEAENIIPPISVETTNNQVSQLGEFTSLLINRVNTLSSVKQSLVDKKEAVTKEDIDIQSQTLLVKQKEFDLEDAKEKLAQHYVKAPFDGIITKVNVKNGDSISANTVLATLITQQKIAEITLNEIDAAKMKVGQKTTLTFDALPDLTLTGKVIEIDTVGTVSQGVVSYGVKIALDTDFEKIKPGMSVTAEIVVEAKPDVLVLPNSAIKSQAGSYYVELVEASEEMRQQLLNNVSGIILPTPPKSQPVEIGLSNDLLTEIVSGLKEGDIVVTSTISPNTVQTTQTQRTQEFRIPGMMR